MESPMHDRAFQHGIDLCGWTKRLPSVAIHSVGRARAQSEWGLSAFILFVSEERRNKLSQDYTVVNSMVSCFLLPSFSNMVWLSPYHGYRCKICPQSLLKAGERIMALHRAYNNLCGISRKDDVLAPRQLEPTKEGGNAGKIPNMDVLIKEFYKESGWTPSGKPSRKTLESLGLKDVARDLYGPKKK
jgi:aldehyde:ferredoxin oxidoreductase